MNAVRMLFDLQPNLVNQVFQRLANNVASENELHLQLEHFFSSLQKAIELSDPPILDGVVSKWASTWIQSISEASGGNLVELINSIMMHSFLVFQKELESEGAILLINLTIPYFSFASQKAAYFEMQSRLGRVENELTLIQNNLQRLDKRKSDFVTVAAHELKTPLTLIEGYTGMLLSFSKNKGVDQKLIPLTTGIQNGTLRLREIINNMIDVSLIDSNILELNFQPCRLDQMLTALQYQFGQSFVERSHVFEIKPFDGFNETFFGDQERLMQVFRNMISNAIKFTPDNGNIWIDGRKLSGFIEVLVGDNGIGISQEDQPLVFDKFSRLEKPDLHSTSKTRFKGGGPGLGLHIVRGIVEAHGGTVWVDSPGYDEVNRPGSIFHILLPFETTPPTQESRKAFGGLVWKSSE